MIKTIKTVLYTLDVCFCNRYCICIVWYAYAESKQEQVEVETQEIVDTLEKIINVTKPDFERANNQTFIDSVGGCVEYIYHTTTDVIPVNLELLLAQAALESGWGNSRFALEGKNLFGIRTYDLRGTTCYLVTILKSGVLEFICMNVTRCNIILTY